MSTETNPIEVTSGLGPQAKIRRSVALLMVVRGIEHDKDLAALLGWSKSKVSRLRSGQTKWELDQLPQVAAALGVSFVDLFKEPADLLANLNPAELTLKYLSLRAQSPTSGLRSSHLLHRGVTDENPAA